MIGLNPADIFTRLRVLAALVFGMLGTLLLWSALVWRQDVIGRKRMLQDLMRSGGANSCGFRQLPTGEWLWALPPIAVDETGHLSGAHLPHACGAARCRHSCSCLAPHAR
jgi:hypothetical protein